MVESSPIMIEFKLYGKFDSDLSLNSRCHWAVKTKLKKQIESMVYYALIESKVKTVRFNRPVEVTIRYNTRLDVDNHGYITKCIVDGLRYAQIIADDNKKYVRRVTQELWNGDYTLVTVNECNI